MVVSSLLVFTSCRRTSFSSTRAVSNQSQAANLLQARAALHGPARQPMPIRHCFGCSEVLIGSFGVLVTNELRDVFRSSTGLAVGCRTASTCPSEMVFSSPKPDSAALKGARSRG
ncbi:uncharacterized protein BDW70DRAFT_129226 [Aspergillus foveolatus]|uniref:uncharacterized protein n=1 Tax=Aspergillus foveolatus TaxID=210207 RepID=UPI003CCD3BBD